MLSAENQISEQEMDAVIARSTYQESKEASSSPGSGTIIARLHSVFSRASQEAPLGALPHVGLLDSLSSLGLPEVIVNQILCFLPAAVFDFCCYLMRFIKVLIMHASYTMR